MDPSNLLKPILDKNSLRIIGSSTHEEFQRTFGKDLFPQPVDFKISLSVNQTMMKPGKLTYCLRSKEHHEIAISSAAIKGAIQLSRRFMKEAFLPDKAIDLWMLPPGEAKF